MTVSSDNFPLPGQRVALRGPELLVVGDDKKKRRTGTYRELAATVRDVVYPDAECLPVVVLKFDEARQNTHPGAVRELYLSAYRAVFLELIA